MSDVPPRNIKNNIQYQFIRNRLEKLMPWPSRAVLLQSSVQDSCFFPKLWLRIFGLGSQVGNLGLEEPGS